LIDSAMFNSLGDLLIPATFNMLYKQDIGHLMVEIKNLPESEEGAIKFCSLMRDIEKKYFCAGVNAVNSMIEAAVSKDN